MYKLVYRISKSYKASVIAAIIYMIAPYHLTDLYSRIAIAELASFIFLPIVFSGMYSLVHNCKKNYLIAIGAIGLILSHNVITVYAAIFCLIYLLANYKCLKHKNRIAIIIVNIAIILLCTSFYWLPLAEHYLGTTYEVFIPQRMYKDNTLISSKLSFLDLFVTKPYDMNFHIGLPIILGLILTIYYRNKFPKKYRKTVLIFLVFGIVSLIMSTKLFPFEWLPDVLKMLQFTWRMQEFSSFFLSVISGIAIAMFMNKNNKKEILIVGGMLIYISILTITSKTEVAIPFNEEKYLEPIPVTSQTGRVHAGCASFEYLPQKAFDNREYIENRNQEVLILQGEASIIEQNKNGTNLSFRIESTSENTKLELPYIYYLGYSAKIKDENGNVTTLKIQESDNGFCMIENPNLLTGNVTVKYTGTILMKISYISTIVGIVMLVIYIKNLKRIT